ncbi:MAG: hypothetical protein R6U98_23950, partial [Pirellulaceae bacterium]
PLQALGRHSVSGPGRAAELKAHSSPAHISDQYANLSSGPGASLQSSPAPSDDPAPFATSSPPPLQTALLPRGLGVGPADVFLGHLFGRNQFERLLSRRYRHDVTDSGNAAGVSDKDDAMSFIKNLGLPRDYADTYSAFGMPPDIWGRGAIGLDYAGQPLVFYMGEPGETVGDPYELVLSRKAAGYTDAPFTVAELERILRYEDVDAFGLPDRLLTSAIDTFGQDPSSSAADIEAKRQNRRRVTTRSRHIPAPGGGVPADRRDELANLVPEAKSNSILDLYRLRLREGGVSEAEINDEMLKIVPWEIWHGQRFNVNRLLGNGRDDNGNNVVDEPAEADGDGEIVWPDRPGLPPGYDGVPFDYFNDDPVFADNPDAKRYAPQIHARHLYCLMMLLTEKVGPGGYLHPSEEAGLTAAERAELTAHRIAQWAINAVDFRDANAIMTPFEYDVNPFNGNGWQDMDGDPATDEGGDRRLVWGAEYPDLLLTEATAFHNRNVKDTANDRAGEGKRKPEEEEEDGDDDLDQYRIPQGSLFLELYCTRNLPTNPRYPDPTNTSFPRELYDKNGMLDLGRLAPGGAPVWRVMISEPLNEADSPLSPLERSQRWTGEGKPDSTSFNPHWTGNPNTAYNMDLPTSLLGAPPPSPEEDHQIEPERYVWFTQQAPPKSGPGWATFFCRNPNPVKLRPGGYAAVGPRELTRVSAADDNDPTTFWVPSPQRIVMSGNTFRMVDNDGRPRYLELLDPPNPIREPLGIICAAHAPPSWSNEALVERGIGLNVSEPLPNDNYYEEPGHVFDTAVGVPDGYAEPDPSERTTDMFPDEPFDNVEGRPLADNNMQHTGTTLDYKAAFVQRLANPLEPHHARRNPYITVDWAAIDLTV